MYHFRSIPPTIAIVTTILNCINSPMRMTSNDQFGPACYSISDGVPQEHGRIDHATSHLSASSTGQVGGEVEYVEGQQIHLSSQCSTPTTSNFSNLEISPAPTNLSTASSPPSIPTDVDPELPSPPSSHASSKDGQSPQHRRSRPYFRKAKIINTILQQPGPETLEAEVTKATHLGLQISCLNCHIKALPCNTHWPTCSRCTRNGEVCLARREVVWTELHPAAKQCAAGIIDGLFDDIADDKAGFFVLQHFPEDSDEDWTAKVHLKVAMLERRGERVDQRNWVYPRFRGQGCGSNWFEIQSALRTKDKETWRKGDEVGIFTLRNATHI